MVRGAYEMHTDPASLTSYGTSGSTLIMAGMTMQEWAAVVAIICAIVTCATNVYFKWRQDQREAKAKDATD